MEPATRRRLGAARGQTLNSGTELALSGVCRDVYIRYHAGQRDLPKIGKGRIVKGIMRALVIAMAFAAAGCVTEDRAPERVTVVPGVVSGIARFSTGAPGDALPGEWRAWTVGKYKKATGYALVRDGGKTVIKASAHASASGLSHEIQLNPKLYPVLTWRWKVPALIAGADNTERQKEDSPVRVFVSFHGDTSKWSFDDRLFAGQMKMLTGYDMPYATLMYIWENRVPRDTVIDNHHTSRVKMIVAESGSGGLGQWRDEVRNVYDDYRRAFGEEPGMTRSIGIMTDTDNTGEKVDAYYGDIAFLRAR
jgi:hypothetical protein